MQAMPTSKQVNHVNIEPEFLHENWSSFCKIYLLTLLFLLKLTSSFHISRPYLATYIIMQELVKEVTLKNHRNNGLAILHGNKRIKISLLTLSVLMHINPTMQVITTKLYIHCSAGADEFTA